jgi:hypothetical protein
MTSVIKALAAVTAAAIPALAAAQGQAPTPTSGAPSSTNCQQMLDKLQAQTGSTPGALVSSLFGPVVNNMTMKLQAACSTPAPPPTSPTPPTGVISTAASAAPGPDDPPLRDPG